MTELHEVRTRPKGFWRFFQGGTSWVLFKKINKPKGFYRLFLRIETHQQRGERIKSKQERLIFTIISFRNFDA
jgi:hypothetical protein